MAKSTRPLDTNQLAKRIVDISTREDAETPPSIINDPKGKNKVGHWGDPHENLNGKHDKEKNQAAEDFRTLIGATDPAKAAPGTIRALFAKNIGENAVHGSDSDENARIEAAFHFSGVEMFR